MKYRREVDGLRAFAVIPVIFFHAGFPLFSGGFVGVDVFFVISGYLITTIILSEKENGTFSLVNFYERRARRIIPALFLVLLVSILFSLLWLYPSHMKDFSKSLIAVSLFSSNILFWQESGYWGAANEIKPLLHTWSLAVEEQYYVLFPLLLLLMWNFRKRWILSSFFIIAILSLLLSQWAAFNKPSANFFLLPTRGWELAIGAGIAFYFLYRKHIILSLLSRKFVDELLSWLGLGLIGYSVFAFDENTPFPGLYALTPTIGTALVIVFSSSETFAGRLLGSKLLVGVGLISYSAYLWHQPLFAFARHRSLLEPSPLLMLVLCFLSLLLAFISWKYVEAPFRRKDTFSRTHIFSFTALGSILLIAFGLAGIITDGFPHRFDKNIVSSLNSAKTSSFSKKLCDVDDLKNNAENEYCVLIRKDRKLAFLYGDSHAEALANEAKKAFSNTDFGLLLATNTACPPVTGVYRADKADKRKCYEQNSRVYDFIAGNPRIEYVILSARWALGMEGERFDNKEGGIEEGRKPHLDIVEKGKYLYHEDYGHREAIAKAYISSVQSLLDAGKKVILIYPIPEAGWNVPDYLGRSYFSDPESLLNESTASTSYEVFLERNKRALDALDAIPSNKNLIRILPENIFCNNQTQGRCITHINNVIFYKDDDHLSDEGARLLIERVISHL